MQTRPATGTIAKIGAFLVALVAALAYRDAITNDFTGGDTIALIEVSRIRSLHDLATMLTQPMLPIITKFYRPTASFSYAVDSWIWGLDARGFHATDVAIHSIVSALVFCLVLRCSKSPVGALLAGLTFALHPSVMETVPSSARRHDMIAGMFILLSLLTLPDPRAVKVRARSWILPVSFCALALGAKEASAVFPVLVFAWARLVHPSSAEGRAPWKSALRVAAPFFAVGLFYVGVRAWVLGGAGGNVHSWTWTLASIPALGTRAADFVGDLVYPVRVLFHPYLNATDRVLACAAAIGMCALTPGIKRLWDSSVSSVDGRPRSRLALHSCLIVGVAALSFPAVSWWIRGAIEQAYRNEGWAFLGRMIDSPRKQPVEFYVWKAFELARITATGALVVSGALLAITWRRARTPKGATSIEQRWSWVFALWILLHLALFLAVQRYHSWYAYVPAIPFCCCIGMVVSKGARPLEIRTALPVGLMVWLAAYSPLVRGLESWRENAKFNGVVMSEISRMAASAPAGSTLEFIDLPNQNFSWHQHGPEPFSPFTINVAGTVSWVKLVQPDRELRVVVKSQRTVQGPVSSIRMVAERAEDQRTIVYSTVTLAPSD